MKAMKRLGPMGLCLVALLASGCDSGGGGEDGGQDAMDAADGQDADDGQDATDGQDADGGQDGGDDGGPLPAGECPFDFTAPRVHDMIGELGEPMQVPDRHILCTLEHGTLRAQVLMQAEPVEPISWDIPYQAWRAFLCQDGQVTELAAADISYEARHHGWDVLQVVLGGRRYVYRWSEACTGYRPCTPSFDCFDVRDQASGTLVEGMVPATCVELSWSGKPLPLTPLRRVPATGPALDSFLYFEMGSADGAADEQPVHTLGMSPQRFDAREATWADLALFLDDHGADCDGTPCLDLAALGVGVELVQGRYLPKAGREDEPAGHVSWAGADAYCMWRGLSLPTEAAWELAASAAGARTYPWGAEAPTCERAVFADCQAAGPAEGCSAGAGASAEGLCDLSGNLAEWIQDWYAADGYAAACDPDTCFPGKEPPCDWWFCHNPGGPEASTGERVLRGGAFDSPADALRAAARGHAPPETASARVGVRCARAGHVLGLGPEP